MQPLGSAENDKGSSVWIDSSLCAADRGDCFFGVLPMSNVSDRLRELCEKIWGANILLPDSTDIVLRFDSEQELTDTILMLRTVADLVGTASAICEAGGIDAKSWKALNDQLSRAQEIADAAAEFKQLLMSDPDCWSWQRRLGIQQQGARILNELTAEIKRLRDELDAARALLREAEIALRHYNPLSGQHEPAPSGCTWEGAGYCMRCKVGMKIAALIGEDEGEADG